MISSPAGGILLILDGWGIAAPGPANAIAAARTPVLDRMLADCPAGVLQASGRAVGLPAGVVGNSEIGHLVIGAGRPLDYDSLLVEQEAQAGRLRAHPQLMKVCAALAATGRTLHVIGLISDGRIHSDIAHVGHLLQGARDAGLADVAVHAITDGRDVAAGTATHYLGLLQRMIAVSGAGRIATLIGRNLAMDKAPGSPGPARACALIVDGDADRHLSDPVRAAEIPVGGNEGDLPATVVTGSGGAPRRVAGGDAILFANFRSDRTAPLADAITRRLAGSGRSDVTILTLAEYDTATPLPALVPRADASGGLADVLTHAHVPSTRIAEREKFDHVTFFVNGRDGAERPGEERICVPGPPEASYTRHPQMNAGQVARLIAAAAGRPGTGLVIANLANIDVVGHTGDFAATIAAAEAVDAAVGQIARSARAGGRWLVIVGDHGNGEQMTQAGAGGAALPYGGHTANPVPVVVVPAAWQHTGRPASLGGGTLADVAPTVLALLGLSPSPVMTGRPLL